MVDIEALRNFEIFEDLDRRELEHVATYGRAQEVKAGTTVFEENALASHLYMVLDGTVEIGIGGGSDHKIVIDTVNAGEVFGWSAVAEPPRFTAGAWATGDTRLVVFDGANLVQLFEINNRIGYRILKRISVVISRRLKARESELIKALERPL
jgi:CRP-like cAMP-binding protein